MKREFFRNEYKYYISTPAARLLDSRLSAVFRKDPYAMPDGSYQILSLYFDDLNSSSFFEKIAGVQDREKFRIRLYNSDLSFLQLEKKEKIGSKIRKTGERILLPEAERIIRGDYAFLFEKDGPLFFEFADKMRSERLKPRLFVQYKRTAYLYSAENVRITLDEEIKGAPFRSSLLPGKVPMVPVLRQGVSVLEVKFNSFLPPMVRDLLSDIPAENTAISKFCLIAEALF